MYIIYMPHTQKDELPADLCAFYPGKSPGLLMQDVARLLRRAFNRRTKDLGLTQAQWQALVYIRRQEGINQITLADYLEVQPISVARLIDRMETAGWIERRRDPNDRRAVNLYLAEKSKPIMEELWACAMEIRAKAFDGISAEEQETLFSLLLRVRGNLSGAETSGAEQ